MGCGDTRQPLNALCALKRASRVDSGASDITAKDADSGQFPI
jgi:hypothetical protein